MDTHDSVLPVPFVRFVRFNNKPVVTDLVMVRYNRSHTFVVSVALESAVLTNAHLIDIATGTKVDIALSKVGGAAGSGHLWTGTVTAAMLGGKKHYLLRVVNGASACEIEIRNSRRG